MKSGFPAEVSPIKFFWSAKSGHCHRVQLILLFLGLPHEIIDLDLAGKERKRPQFLKLSPFGLVPAVDDNGFVLSDSSATLVYLVRKHPSDHNWAPQDPERAADVQRWLFVAASEIAFGPCAARLAVVFGAPVDREAARTKSHSLFKVMDPISQHRPYLVGTEITIADVAGYTAT